jgi:hypothetical protein
MIGHLCHVGPQEYEAMSYADWQLYRRFVDEFMEAQRG